MERKQCEEQTLVAEEKGTVYVWDPANWNNNLWAFPEAYIGNNEKWKMKNFGLICNFKTPAVQPWLATLVI